MRSAGPDDAAYPRAVEFTELLKRRRMVRAYEPTPVPRETLSPQLVSTLTEPFQRRSERIRNDHAGVGLGLAIVKSITQVHDGTLTLTPRAAGGLCVTVQLPAAPPHTGR